jgi:hypothetical protein
MLAAQLGVEIIFELVESVAAAAGNGDGGGGLVFGGVHLDVVLEGVVVDVVFPAQVSMIRSRSGGIETDEELTYEDSIVVQIPAQTAPRTSWSGCAVLSELMFFLPECPPRGAAAAQ